MHLPFPLSGGWDTMRSAHHLVERFKFKWSRIFRSAAPTATKPSSTDPSLSPAGPLSWRPLPTHITDRISTEIYELIIDYLSTDKLSLLACHLVCRSWVPRSQCVLHRRMPCRPLSVVRHGRFGTTTTCAASLRNNAGLICGTKGGIYRSNDGVQLLPLRNVSQIEILPDANLVLCVAGGTFYTLPLSVLSSGVAQREDMTRILQNVSSVAVYRGKFRRESSRVCVFKGSTFGTIYIFDVSGSHQASTLVLTHVRVLDSALRHFTAKSISLQTLAVTRQHFLFLSSTRLLTWSKTTTMHGGFDSINLDAPEAPIRTLLDCQDPSLEFALKKLKPRTVFKLSEPNRFLVCYEKIGFYVNGGGKMARNKQVMEWGSPSNGFALREPHVLAFCNKHTEVWDMRTAKLVQTIEGTYQPLNDGLLTLCHSSGDVVDFVFHE
ncbi:CNH domain-containing protein [Mycena filopes]|nr:CNH domain-containing protein [Mycena filopes]